MASRVSRPFGRVLIPAVRALNARGLKVVQSDGESAPAQLPPGVLRRVRHPLRFRVT